MQKPEQDFKDLADGQDFENAKYTSSHCPQSIKFCGCGHLPSPMLRKKRPGRGEGRNKKLNFICIYVLLPAWPWCRLGEGFSLPAGKGRDEVYLLPLVVGAFNLLIFTGEKHLTTAYGGHGRIAKAKG